MRTLVLTGLGNEVDLKTSTTIFTAVFNDHVRIRISEEAAQILTNYLFADSKTSTEKESFIEPKPDVEEEYPRLAGTPVLTDVPGSVYDADTGIEQV